MANTYYDLEENLTKWGTDEYGKPNSILRYAPPSSMAGLKCGDLIVFNDEGIEEDRYRNEGVYIWDGKSIEELDYSIDEYGSLPSKYKIGKKFNLDHWTITRDGNKYFMIAHNEIIYLDKGLYKKIKIKFDDKSQKYTGTLTLNKNINVEFEEQEKKITDLEFLKSHLSTYPPMHFINDQTIKCII